MEIGLYGSTSGLSPEQTGCINNLLKKLKPDAIHRCNNYGVAYEFHQIAVNSTKSRIIVHPLHKDRVLRQCSANVSKVLPPKDNIIRDQEFIEDCDHIVVALDTRNRQDKANNIAFIHKASKQNKELTVVDRSGKVYDKKQISKELLFGGKEPNAWLE